MSEPRICIAGHDLDVVGTYTETDGRKRCKKCRSERVNRCQKRKRSLRRELERRSTWVNQGHPKSAGDG